MKEVIIYGSPSCPYCNKARALFQELNVSYKDEDVSVDAERKNELKKKYNWPTIPMIVIGDRFIGGFDDLNTLHQKGDLIKLFS